MKIKLDENMPRRVEDLLRGRGHDLEDLGGCTVVVSQGRVRIRRPN